MNVGMTHWQGNERQQREDQLTVEEPFEVRIDQRSLAVIIRTPGHDHELAMGFLFTEGVIRQPGDVLTIEDATEADGLPLTNIVNIVLRHNQQQDMPLLSIVQLDPKSTKYRYNKLEVSSRSAATRFAIQHHLVCEEHRNGKIR